MVTWAIVPISAETIKCCDCVLMGAADSRDLRDLMADHNAHSSKSDWEDRKERGTILDQEVLMHVLAAGWFYLQNCLVE